MIFLRVPISLLESTTIAFEAVTVPAVIPSMVSSSASLITADPIVNPVAVTMPPDVTAPEDSTAPSILIVPESSARSVPANMRSSLIVIAVESTDDISLTSITFTLNVPDTFKSSCT